MPFNGALQEISGTRYTLIKMLRCWEKSGIDALDGVYSIIYFAVHSREVVLYILIMPELNLDFIQTPTTGTFSLRRSFCRRT